MAENEVEIFGYFIDRTAKSIKADLSRRFRKVGVNLTPEQWIILSKLYDKDGQPQVSIGDSTYKDAPTISRIIDLLCKKGFTKRISSKGDRRKFLIYITQSGKATVDKARPVVIQSRIDGWYGLSKEDHKDLLRVVNKIYKNLNEV